MRMAMSPAHPALLRSLVLACLALGSFACSAPAAPAPTQAPTVVQAPAPTQAPTKQAAPTIQATKAPAAQPTTVPANKVNYPEKGKPVNVIMPAGAGGPLDVGGRIVAAAMETDLGVPFPVVNKAGATGMAGFTDLVQAKPDGHTISAFSVLGHVGLYVDPSRKPTFGRKDLQPIAGYGIDDQLLSVRADSPYKNMKDLMDAAKANPRGIKVASGGVMGGPHICWMELQDAAGVKFSIVPFDSGAQEQTALAGGHVDASLASTAGALGLLKAGTLRGIGISGTQESVFVPGVKTFQDQGYNLQCSTVHGFSARAGVPQEIITVLQNSVKKATQDATVRSRLEGAGEEPRFQTAEQFGATWTAAEADVKKGMELVKLEQ